MSEPVCSPELLPQLAEAVGGTPYPASATQQGALLFSLLRRGETKFLAILAPEEGKIPAGFRGQGRTLQLGDRPYHYRECPRTAANAAALRDHLEWLRPRPLGLHQSVGTGDRLGLATPAHAAAVARYAGQGERGMLPIFAQQSIRENARTRRTPQEVLDDATWGVFEAGWRGGYGADADHLKHTDDIDITLAAGYTFFTIDPGEHVASDADALPEEALEARLQALPWEALEASPRALEEWYLQAPFELEGRSLRFDRRSLAVAAVKYGRAVAHTVAMYRYLAARRDEGQFELEVSVDETESPTTHLEHLYIASELKRLGVRWVSLAPRFVGRFEKGTDYQGTNGGLQPEDLERFRQDFAGHAAIARALGPYKLSLHSGSDKFSIYPIASELAGPLVHLKTAGTSYLEALRTIARVAPALFREIYTFARGRFPEDRASYHVSAEVARMPELDGVADEALPALLDQFDARQALHVTFGSVLNAQAEDGSYRFKEPLLATLCREEATHYDILVAHFERHLAPFCGGTERSEQGEQAER